MVNNVQTNSDPYLDDALTGGQRQPYQAGVINAHNLVPYAEFSGASSGATIQHTSQNDGGQNGAPTRLHDHHTKALPFLFLHIQLEQKIHYTVLSTHIVNNFYELVERPCSRPKKNLTPLYSCLSSRSGRGHHGTFLGS